MSLHLTNRISLEKNDVLFKDLTKLYTSEERARLKVKVDHFVETVLDYNPDATEQIDIRDKHLSCAENLGEINRKKTLLLCEEQNETYDKLYKACLKPLPFWLKDVFTGLSNMISRLNPSGIKIKANRIHEISKLVPILSKQTLSYFKRLEKDRQDCERLVIHFDSALIRLGRFELDLNNQLEDIKLLSRSLYHAIEFGYMIEQGLTHAITTDIPDDDPRIGFIENELAWRFKERIAMLRIQMTSNHKSMISQYIYLLNCRELIRGLAQAKSLAIEVFNLAAQCGAIVHGKQMFRKLGADMDSTIMGRDNPAEQFANLNHIFSELDDSMRALQAFITEAGSLMKETFEEKLADEKKTADLFEKLKQSLQNALKRNLAEL